MIQKETQKSNVKAVDILNINLYLLQKILG